MVSSKTGKIKKATGDFAVRKGVTQKPLADIEIFSNATFSSVLVSQALQYLLVKMLTEVK